VGFHHLLMVASLRGQDERTGTVDIIGFHHLLMVASLRETCPSEPSCRALRFPPSSDGGFIAGRWTSATPETRCSVSTIF